ncbi:hypothetical protein K439DRAFT_1625732 [Ramaria rubella]|nr:hypothetical protein K439DRAFT_1625732 [Ramaria rubella]
MLLIGAFGLFWLSFLVILRAFRSRGSHGLAGGAPLSTGSAGAKRPEWCSGDDVYCIVEEWKYSRY